MLYPSIPSNASVAFSIGGSGHFHRVPPPTNARVREMPTLLRPSEPPRPSRIFRRNHRNEAPARRVASLVSPNFPALQSIRLKRVATLLPRRPTRSILLLVALTRAFSTCPPLAPNSHWADVENNFGDALLAYIPIPQQKRFGFLYQRGDLNLDLIFSDN